MWVSLNPFHMEDDWKMQTSNYIIFRHKNSFTRAHAKEMLSLDEDAIYVLILMAWEIRMKHMNSDQRIRNIIWWNYGIDDLQMFAMFDEF